MHVRPRAAGHATAGARVAGPPLERSTAGLLPAAASTNLLPRACRVPHAPRALARRGAALSLAWLLASLPAAAGEGTLVVLNKSEATASLIDLDRGASVATVPTGEGPHEVAVSPDGRLAVVADYGTREKPGSTLTVIDVASAKAVRTIALSGHSRPHGIAWLPDGKRAVVTVEESRAALLVDVAAGKVLHAIGTGQDVSHMVAVAADGSRAFVANIGSGSVTALDLDKAERIRDIVTGEGAEGIDISPDGAEVWVTNREADTVTVIDAAGLGVLATLDVKDPSAPDSRPFPIRARCTPDGRHVLVSNARGGEVIVIDRAKRAILRRIPMKLTSSETEGRLFGGQFGESSVPIGILIPPSGKRAYIANANADVVSVLDLTTWELTGSLRPGREPDGMAWSPLAVEENARR